MIRLLVNAPSGMQEIVYVSVAGGYFDQSRVIWDERTDGPLPDLMLGKMQRSGDQLITLADYLPAHAAVLLAEAKTAKLTELQTAYETANYADIEHASKTWKADQAAQQLLAAVLAPGSVSPGMYWRDITQTKNPMTFAELQALGRAMLDRGLLLDDHFGTKKSAVDAATTIEEINAINW